MNAIKMITATATQKTRTGRYIESDVVFSRKWLINRLEHVIELISLSL